MIVTIETNIDAPLEKVWDSFTTPNHITQWNFANDDWCCPKADINLQENGNFSYQMKAKDDSIAFDLNGTFVMIREDRKIVYKLEDGRIVSTSFTPTKSGIAVDQIFQTEDENPVELQQQGWQAILDNFKLHVESQKA